MNARNKRVSKKKRLTSSKKVQDRTRPAPLPNPNELIQVNKPTLKGTSSVSFPSPTPRPSQIKNSALKIESPKLSSPLPKTNSSTLRPKQLPSTSSVELTPPTQPAGTPQPTQNSQPSRPLSPKKVNVSSAQKKKEASSSPMSSSFVDDDLSNQPNESYFETLNQTMMIVLAGVFFLLAIPLFIRGRKKGFSSQNEASIRVISQKQIHAQHRQSIMVVEVLDQTLIIGSCPNGGLNLLARIPDEKETYLNPPTFEQPAYPQAPSTYDQFDQYDEYTEPQGSYDTQGYDEASYVEDHSYTAEVPMMNMNPSHDQPTKEHPMHQGTDPSANLGGMNALLDEVSDQVYTSSSSSTDQENVSADDLLQKIRQLNRG
jgi:flagellar biogenesis protein FliO